MRLNVLLASVLFSSAALVGNALADDESSAEESSSTAVNRPAFTPTELKAPFLEQFTDDWEDRWKASHAKKEDSKTDEEWAYVGEWSVEEPTVFRGIDGDNGLVVKNAAAHHAISSKFVKPIDNTDKTLVVQYEVKLQNGLECGGAYMKLLQDNEALHQEEFSNASPYVIMFGPDKCGATNKVHFIFRHKNPISGEYEEKHLRSPPTARLSKTSTLYRLTVFPNQTYAIDINGEQSREGSLFEDFNPAILPPEEIDDPDDKKPEDWVDQARIPDPEATKPEDWDEEAPFEIVDEEAVIPEDWLVDEPLSIPDPEAEKPEDWDDEEDGDWIPPTVPNPKCDEVSGCGAWTKPMKKNPEYKGKWHAPMIDNPDYKGAWAPRKIPNPNYFEDKTPANFEPMGAIGFEIWTMQNNILFDNIYIGHSIEDADKFKAETFDIKLPIEKEEETASLPKKDTKSKSESNIKFTDDPVTFVREKWSLFLTLAQKNPVEALKLVPEVAIGLGGLFVTLLALVGGILAVSKSSATATKKTPAKGKEPATGAKDKAAEAATTGAEKAKGDVKKRAEKAETTEE